MIGVPKGPLLGKLKSKQDITLEDGKIVKWKDGILNKLIPELLEKILKEEKL
jgi:hypothetical protein